MVIGVAVVNVGAPALLAEAGGERVYSGIAKRPVATGTVLWLSLVNLSGDGQADLSVHGGPDKAVYGYPSEHLPAWEAELGEPLGDAPFGENLSTVGTLEHEVRIGDRWRWDDAVLEVCQPRWPCFKLALHRQRADIQGRMRQNGAPAGTCGCSSPVRSPSGRRSRWSRPTPAACRCSTPTRPWVTATSSAGTWSLPSPSTPPSPPSGASPSRSGSPDQPAAMPAPMVVSWSDLPPSSCSRVLAHRK